MMDPSTVSPIVNVPLKKEEGEKRKKEEVRSKRRDCD